MLRFLHLPPTPQLDLSSTPPNFTPSLLFALSLEIVRPNLALFAANCFISLRDVDDDVIFRGEKPSNTGSYSHWGTRGLHYGCHGESEPCFLFNNGDRMTSLCATANNKLLRSHPGEQAVYVHHYGHLDGKTHRRHNIRPSVCVR